MPILLALCAVVLILGGMVVISVINGETNGLTQFFAEKFHTVEANK